MEEKKLRILVIGAHPDDCEIKAAGLAAKFSKMGHKVKFVSATNGDTGHYSMGGAQLAQRRSQETKKAGELIGIENEVLDIHNNGLEADISTREIFIRLIREFNPDIIITHRLNDYHPDHRRTAMLVQDSSYAIRIPNVCPLTPYMTHTPVILYMQDNFQKPTPFAPDVVIDIDDVIDTKTAMLDCHVSQVYEWLPWMDGYLDKIPDDPQERIKWLKGNLKTRQGNIDGLVKDKLYELYGDEHAKNVKWVEAFEISEYGAKLPKDKIPHYFPFIRKAD
jgi:LmbE family N-acetylglucosaminyl deacetylase